MRSPVVHKGQRVEGLWQRTTSDGEIRFDAVTKVRGRVVRRVLSAQTVTDAIRERHELLVELRGTQPRGESAIFSEARKAYVAHLEALAGTGERSTRSSKAASERLVRFKTLEDLRLDEIGSPEFSEAVAGLRKAGFAAWTIKTTIGAFSAMWTYSARERGWCSESARPTLSTPVKINRTNARQARRLNDGQLHDLVQSATDVGKPLVAILAYTGLRISEVLALTWEHIDFVDGEIRVEQQMGRDGKATERLKAESSRRSVPIPPALSTILIEHLAKAEEIERSAPGDFVLMSACRTAFTHRRALTLFGKAVKKAKLGHVVPHDTRHSYGSRLLDRGVPLPTVSEWLGHASVEITARIYAGVLEGRTKEQRQSLVELAFGSGDHEVATDAVSSTDETTQTPEMQEVP
jgi:integrase